LGRLWPKEEKESYDECKKARNRMMLNLSIRFQRLKPTRPYKGELDGPKEDKFLAWKEDKDNKDKTRSQII
jgi:hypothetical protein